MFKERVERSRDVGEAEKGQEYVSEVNKGHEDAGEVEKGHEDAGKAEKEMQNDQRGARNRSRDGSTITTGPIFGDLSKKDQ